MWKNRFGYIMIVVVSLILLFFYSRPFLLYTVLLMLGGAVLLLFLLFRDAEKLRLKPEIRTAMHQGGTVALRIHTNCRGSLLAAGYVLLKLNIHNEMFDKTEQRRLLLNLQDKTDFYELPVDAKWCGAVSIECDDIYVFDIFKLFRLRTNRMDTISTVIYPREVRVSVASTGKFAGLTQEEDMVQNRKGNDPSETFDIREYVPGDDVRSIHWKLSSKTDTLILREASDPMHYQAVLLPDFGLDQLNGETAADEINTAIGIGDALCRSLIRKGISFCVALPTDRGIQLREIRSDSDYRKMRTRWMSIRIQKKSGNGLQLFRTEHMERCFSRLLILSASQYEQNLSVFDGQISVTLMNVTKESDEMKISRNGTCEIIKLPTEQKENSTYRIMC